MKQLSREQCDRISGGDPGMVLAGGGFGIGGSGGTGFGSGGTSFGSGGIDFGGGVGGSSFDSVATAFGSSVGSGLASVWEGSGGFEPSAGAGMWSLEAIGIEGGTMAVVRISAADAPGIPVFDNTPSVSYYGPGEAPWEGQYLGQWQLPAPLSYAHTAFDGALIANTGRLTGAATAAFIEGAIVGAEVGWPAGPIGAVGGIVVGGLAA